MRVTTCKVPKLRFKEFSGEWVEKKLGEILKIGSGKDYKHLEKGNIPVFGTGGYMTSVNNFLYDGESVCIGRKGTIDKPVFISGKFWTVDTLFYTYSFKQSVPFFIYLLFQRINWKKYNEASGVPSLSKSTIETIKINLPSKPEQEKIASFLSAVDSRIEQLTKKEQLLREYKKGVMQKIFSQEICFKDDDGSAFPEWVEKRLGEVLKTISTKPYQIPSANIVKIGKFKVVDQGQKAIAGFSNNEDKVFKNNGVIIYGDHTTIVKFVDFDFIIGADGTKLLISSNNHHLKYLFYNLVYNNINAEGYKRHFSILKNIFLQLPSLKEQTKIASFLSAADEKITLTQKQLDATKAFKKALLQQMFV